VSLRARTCRNSDTNYFSAFWSSESSSPFSYSNNNDSKINQLQNICRGRAMSQTVSRVHTANSPFWSQTKWSVILGRENDITNKFPSKNFGNRLSTSIDQSAKIINSFVIRSFSTDVEKNEQLTDSSSDTLLRIGSVYKVYLFVTITQIYLQAVHVWLLTCLRFLMFFHCSGSTNDKTWLDNGNLQHQLHVTNTKEFWIKCVKIFVSKGILALGL
jgi:hypothetical protein